MKISPLGDLFFIHFLLIMILGFKLPNSVANLSFSWKYGGHLYTSIVEADPRLCFCPGEGAGNNSVQRITPVSVA